MLVAMLVMMGWLSHGHSTASAFGALIITTFLEINEVICINSLNKKYLN